MREGAKRRGWDFIFGLLLGGITTAVLGYTAYYLPRTVQKDARLARLPLPVQAVAANVKMLHETIGASGTIQPSMPIVLTAKVVSQVLRVRVDLGAVVMPGDVLVEMDQRLYKANLDSTQVSYDHAQRQLQRMTSLMQKNYAAAVDVEKARTDLAAAREAVVQAEIALSNTRILAPAPAVVIAREINPGEITKVDQNLIQLGVLDPVMMVAQVPEDKIGAVYVGMKGVVGTDAFPGENFTGTVAKIDSQVNDATRTFAAYVQLANGDLRLKKGVTGYARLEGTRMALVVPSTAVMNPVGDRATVFVIGKDQRAHLREIRPGMTVEGMTEVFEGLQERDNIVAMGQFDLRDNDLVSVNRFAPWNQ